MRFKFFPGSELSPPFLLGGIIDLDKPTHLIANLILDDNKQIKVRPVKPIPEEKLGQLKQFVSTIPPTQFRRVAMRDIMHYTSRRKAMC